MSRYAPIILLLPEASLAAMNNDKLMSLYSEVHSERLEMNCDMQCHQILFSWLTWSGRGRHDREISDYDFSRIFGDSGAASLVKAEQPALL